MSSATLSLCLAPNRRIWPLVICSPAILFFFISRSPLHLIECVYRELNASLGGPAFSYHLGLGLELITGRQRHPIRRRRPGNPHPRNRGSICPGSAPVLR